MEKCKDRVVWGGDGEGGGVFIQLFLIMHMHIQNYAEVSSHR